MDFQREYLGDWVNDDSYEKADLLWLWYDYHTEIYDRGLWSAIPSPNDETMVIHTSPEAQRLSNINASRAKHYMLNAARHYLLSDDVLHNAKISGYRNRASMQKRIEDYLKLDKIGKFKFINDLL